MTLTFVSAAKFSVHARSGAQKNHSAAREKEEEKSVEARKKEEEKELENLSFFKQVYWR